MIVEEKWKSNIMTMFQKGKLEIIVHGCNCFGIMGAGLARQVSLMYPYALDVDRGINEKGEMEEALGNYNRLGTYSEVPTDDGIILNCYTQFEPGANFEYLALIKVLEQIDLNFSGKTIGFPRIGCGIGGGSWRVVKQLINEHTPNVDIIIVHLEEKPKKKEDAVSLDM
jgi:O-acetyl-ADP-ribose deacetylase (regulator of RNase III)